MNQKLSQRKISVSKEAKEKKDKKVAKELKEIKEINDEQNLSIHELDKIDLEIRLRNQFQELLIPFIAKIEDLNNKFEQQNTTVNIINRKIGELLFKYTHLQKENITMEDLNKKLEKIDKFWQMSEVRREDDFGKLGEKMVYFEKLSRLINEELTSVKKINENLVDDIIQTNNSMIEENKNNQKIKTELSNFVYNQNDQINNLVPKITHKLKLAKDFINNFYSEKAIISKRIEDIAEKNREYLQSIANQQKQTFTKIQDDLEAKITKRFQENNLQIEEVKNIINKHDENLMFLEDEIQKNAEDCANNFNLLELNKNAWKNLNPDMMKGDKNSSIKENKELNKDENSPNSLNINSELKNGLIIDDVDKNSAKNSNLIGEKITSKKRADTIFDMKQDIQFINESNLSVNSISNSNKNILKTPFMKRREIGGQNKINDLQEKYFKLINDNRANTKEEIQKMVDAKIEEKIRSVIENLNEKTNLKFDLNEQWQQNFGEQINKIIETNAKNQQLLTEINDNQKDEINLRKNLKSDTKMNLSSQHSRLYQIEAKLKVYDHLFEQISQILNVVVNDIELQQLIEIANENEKKYISLYGIKSKKEKLDPKANLSILELDDRCITCAKEPKNIEKAFKIACLKYKSYPIQFEDHEYHKDYLLDFRKLKLIKMIKECNSIFPNSRILDLNNDLCDLLAQKRNFLSHTINNSNNLFHKKHRPEILTNKTVFHESSSIIYGISSQTSKNQIHLKIRTRSPSIHRTFGKPIEESSKYDYSLNKP